MRGEGQDEGDLAFPAVIVHPFDLEAMQAQPLHRSLGVGAVLRLDRDFDHGALRRHVQEKAAVMDFENVRAAAAELGCDLA